jgi:glucosamine-6-phosphate deaminase
MRQDAGHPQDPLMHSSTFDLLDVCQYPDRASVGMAAAALVARSIRAAYTERGEARVVFACAPSQNEFLAALTDQEIEWSKVSVFHMDEYIGLGAENPQSFRRYLGEHLLAHIDPPRTIHLIRAEENSENECQRYSALLSEKPIDIVCLGIGENGHIAFNDPPVADFHDARLVKIVALDAMCRQQQVNDGCFATLDAVPAHAITLTIPTLLGAREISCVVLGERKARAVRATLLGAIETACPASILRTHPRVVLHIDQAAAFLLPK